MQRLESGRPSVYFCIEPCHKYYNTSLGLQVHRGRSPNCRARWEEQVAADFQRSMARHPMIDHRVENPGMDASDGLWGVT